MNKRFSGASMLILLIHFIASSTFAQTKVQKYIGIIRVDEVGPFTYQLNVEKTASNKISGTTITNAGNSQETETLISGQYSANQKELSFVETKISKTNVKDKNVDFCFVNAKLTIKKRGNLEVLEGDFIGKDENGKQIASGKIMLTRKSAIMNDDEDFGKLIQKVADTLKTIQNKPAKPLSIDKLNEIDGVSKKCLVRFYDGNNEDGDLISIRYNDETITKRLELTNKGLSHTFALEAGKSNIVSVKTLNVGTVSPNTVNIDVHKADGKIETYIIEAEASKEIRIRLSSTNTR